MAEKLMSIMVLNWNRKEYSSKTIENILQKTTVNHELILIDNNSTEESGVRQYLSSVKGNTHTKEIKLVFNDRNFGVGGGRNMGLLRATGEYLCTIDDDVLVPDKWDLLIAEACDKIPKLGITGVNVEPIKFPVKIINGVKMRPKSSNLGGACLCLPRRVFKHVGFYMAENIYGMEDVEMRCRLDLAGLISAYIVPKGVHMDNDSLKEYRKVKNDAHARGSKQTSALSRFRRKLGEQFKKTGSLYVPFNPDNFKPVDEQVFTNELIK